MSTTHEQERLCPHAHPSTPHSMRRDESGWYCPHERDVQMAERDRERAQVAAEAEAVQQSRAVIDRTLLVIQRHAAQELSGGITCACAWTRFPDIKAWAAHVTSALAGEGLLAAAIFEPVS